jgi:hypothetical protein
VIAVVSKSGGCFSGAFDRSVACELCRLKPG